VERMTNKIYTFIIFATIILILTMLYNYWSVLAKIALALVSLIYGIGAFIVLSFFILLAIVVIKEKLNLTNKN
jgi:hypothetical protein